MNIILIVNILTLIINIITLINMIKITITDNQISVIGHAEYAPHV